MLLLYSGAMETGTLDFPKPRIGQPKDGEDGKMGKTAEDNESGAANVLPADTEVNSGSISFIDLKSKHTWFSVLVIVIMRDKNLNKTKTLTMLVNLVPTLLKYKRQVLQDMNSLIRNRTMTQTFTKVHILFPTLTKNIKTREAGGKINNFLKNHETRFIFSV